MTEVEIRREAEQELSKGVMQLAMDVIREANTLPAGPASEKENLDLIKHLIKRLAVHQVSLDASAKRATASAKKATALLIMLSAIMAIGALFQVLSYFQMP